MAPRVDLLLAGGRVIDSANHVDAPADVAIAAGRIVAVGSNLRLQAETRVDLSGLIVTPGLLDIHTHVYTVDPPPSGSYVECMHADAHLLASGVTTTVDAGTAGWRNFPEFKERCIDRSTVRILAFLNIAAQGMVNGESEQSPAELDPAIAAAVATAYSTLIVGIKTAHYWTSKPWDAEHEPWVSVDRALDAAGRCGKPVMVDFWPRPPERPYPELILEKLRPGDMHTHIFAQQFPIVDANGKLYDHLFKARKRGVIFDLGHGAGSFWFRNAVPALEQGFPPDSISTDFHMGNVNGPVVSMLRTMSKCLAMGMPLPEVIERSTAVPARNIGRQDLGSLSVGAGADVAVLRLEEGEFGYTDCGRAKLLGSRRLECLMTLRDGKIVFDPSGLSMPSWREAPPSYWAVPGLQG